MQRYRTGPHQKCFIRGFVLNVLYYSRLTFLPIVIKMEMLIFYFNESSRILIENSDTYLYWYYLIQGLRNVGKPSNKEFCSFCCKSGFFQFPFQTTYQINRIDDSLIKAKKNYLGNDRAKNDSFHYLIALTNKNYWVDGKSFEWMVP